MLTSRTSKQMGLLVGTWYVGEGWVEVTWPMVMGTSTFIWCFG